MDPQDRFDLAAVEQHGVFRFRPAAKHQGRHGLLDLLRVEAKELGACGRGNDRLVR
ncbi:MAG: hypothetical protein H6732_14715 [Alphaproteobacteria bacterium]|nr:hypothetical protein [Alphaproteobacteria bacterium]